MTQSADPAHLGVAAALRASEERLRHIVEHAQDLIYCCDVQGRFTYVNPAAARLMKYHADELIGRHFLQLIHADHHRRAQRERYLQHVRRSAQRGVVLHRHAVHVYDARAACEVREEIGETGDVAVR